MLGSLAARSRMSLGVVLLILLAQISIPLPGGVPITLQTFGVALVGYLYGARASFQILLAYLLLGVCGLPVFSGLSGGLTHLIGPTGGFLWGFFPLAGLCCAEKEKRRN